MSPRQPFVRLRGVTKRFGTILANDHIDLDIYPGEILALLGENGAGKTTLTKILYGMYGPDEGEILVNGAAVRLRTPADAIRRGIGFVSQHFSLVPTLTVAENVVLGREGSPFLQRARLESAVAETALRYGLGLEPRARVATLSVGVQQRVEILKALYQGCKLLILDEPTAVLTPQDAERLFETLEGLRKGGLSVILITHKLAEVKCASSRVAVLRHGKVAGERVTQETSEGDLARLMIGREVRLLTRERQHEQGGEPILDVRGLGLADARGVKLLKAVSFTLHAGEMVGIAAVAGNGQSELVAILTGMTSPTAGEVRLGGKPIQDLPPQALSALGVGRIPEDRLQAVIGDLSVLENLTLEHLSAFSRSGRLERRRMEAEAKKLIEAFGIKAKPEDKARTLSGGNLQKLLLARTLSREPKVVIAAQPTRGLDVGATGYVHERLLEQKARGAAILLVSEDLDEVLRLSDRILVMHAGEIVGEMAGMADLDEIGLLMAGQRGAARA